MKDKKLHRAITELAALKEPWSLLADTNAACFIEEVRKEILDLHRQLATAQATLDKLPKDREGNPVVPYTELFYPINGEIWECGVGRLIAKTPHGADIAVRLCSSTREAAQAALAAKEDGA